MLLGSEGKGNEVPKWDVSETLAMNMKVIDKDNCGRG